MLETKKNKGMHERARVSGRLAENGLVKAERHNQCCP